MQSMFRGLCLVTVVGWATCQLVGCADSSEANTIVSTSPVDSSIPVRNINEPDADVTPSEPGIDESAEPEAELSADQQMEQAFLGTWQLEDHGLRTIEVKADGSASMHIELDFFASLIYGDEMTMELTWFVRDGVLTYSVVSGHPVESVDRVVNDFGRERSYRVLELDTDRIQLQDVKFPGNKYDWVNVGVTAEQG
jgi:hypothetical protein